MPYNGEAVQFWRAGPRAINNLLFFRLVYGLPQQINVPLQPPLLALHKYYVAKDNCPDNGICRKEITHILHKSLSSYSACTLLKYLMSASMDFRQAL